MKIINHLVITITLLLSANTFAADPPVYSHPKKGAIAGADVVAYYGLEAGEKAVKGSDSFTYDWKGATWKFATSENKQKFINNPEAYAPQYGGYCAYAVAQGFTVEIDPNRWKIVNGKLYLNYNRIAYFRWNNNKEDYIKQADANWPSVLKVCEKDNTCQETINPANK